MSSLQLGPSTRFMGMLLALTGLLLPGCRGGSAAPEPTPLSVISVKDTESRAESATAENLMALPTDPSEPDAVDTDSGRPVICIDPGHPSEVNDGRTTQNGTNETHIDWVVAQRLKSLLEKRGYQVVMTKSREEQMVKNRERALIANQSHAALMVRLHCDSSSDKGYALYYPDRQGTAQGKTGPTPDIRKRSHDAATVLDAGMAKVLDGKLKNGGVRGDSQTAVGSKQGALTGSIFSEVPVVTIEMVVLSNKGDAAFIKTEAGQQQMAQAIADGIARFVPISR